MPTLKVSPNPVALSGDLLVEGSGFTPKAQVQCSLDGVGWTTYGVRAAKDGTFRLYAMKAGATAKTQTVSARYKNTSVIVAQATVVVQAVIVPPVDPPADVTVASIFDLMSALANNQYSRIRLKPDRYYPANAGFGAGTPTGYKAGLWIGRDFAGRTNPVIVDVTGSVFDGQGHGSYGAISFEDGAHDQTWLGFTADNGEATDTGVITVGGYTQFPGAHHITMDGVTLLPGLRGHTRANDHGIYISNAATPPHDFLFKNLDVQGGPIPLSSGYHHDHDPNNGYNIVVDGFKIKGVYTGAFLYSESKHDITLKNGTIDACREVGVDYSHPTPNTRLENVRVTNTPIALYIPRGTAGLTLVGCNFS